MSKKDEHTGLSSEDAALWKKVTRTLSSIGAQPKHKYSKDKSLKSGPSRSSTDESENRSADQDDFAALLSEQEQEKAKISKLEISDEEETNVKAGKQPAKRRIQTPSREDFAALLDNPNAVISTDKFNPPEDSQSLKPSLPSYRPAIDQKQTKKSQPTIETFNQRDARNISSGKQTIDAAIDLHGLTQNQAETALKTFLKRAHLDNKRTVLVITGKGQRRNSSERSFELGAPEPGIIKRSVPNWLDDMPDVVLSYTTSHSKHGGEGALYVRLRRLTKPGK